MFDGQVNRSDIRDKFGVSDPQASIDLQKYLKLAPDNLAYNGNSKRYEATPSFKPLKLEEAAETYLSRLQWVAEGFESATESWIGTLPELDMFRPPVRHVKYQALRAVLAALKSRQSLSVLYVSMNPAKPEPLWRQVSPHALMHDGFRWHARCWCHINNQFRDFMLSRILDTGELGTPGLDPSQDYVWHEKIDVIIGPNPRLAAAQQRVIADDYGMEGGQRAINLRLAMLYYFRKHMRLDLDPEQMDPQQHNLVILNPDDVQRGIDRANYRDIRSEQGQ